ncbi:tuftelin-interacting protein 11-like isoform X2 [Artemia franciscana]|uniref:tuftelin-interacting protein 11-like isoform X2 n=1 Tax=Artemia franciscana TaxID=6661 RepID=UPI0032D9CA06
MNNDEYREEFGISDRDLEDAMGRRSGFRRLTKEQQIYGVFNDSDAEEETTVSRKQKKSYTTPLSFVAGGVVQAGKKKEDLGEDEEAEMEEEEETIIHTLKGRNIHSRRKYSEENTLKILVDREENQLKSSTRLLGILEDLEKRFSDISNPLTLSYLASVLTQLQTEYYEEYHLYDYFSKHLHHFILPKIQSEVDTWNPLTDTIPIHSWVHPWIPLLGQNLDIVYPTIRQKLGYALINWHPSDKSARLVLEPWLTVFPKAHMDAFLIKHIVPKLAKELNAMTINPQSQVLDQWNWVMAWEDLLPIVQVTTMLEKFFFPKWLQVLATWLNHNPNYEEVTNWYKGWKVLFLENIAKHPSVYEQLTKALDIMNRAVQMASEAPPRVPQPFIPFPTRPALLPTPPPRINQPQSRVEMSMPSGFKDLVIRRCEERGILIMPVDRWQEGKQVYKCGSGFIYFDKNVIFAEDNGTRWIPISIHTLLETVGFVAGNQPQSQVEMSMPSGFKDLVIRRCEERGILIMPVDRWQEGKQVYKCGSGFIYFDKNVIFAEDNGTRWIPISIHTLLETVGFVAGNQPQSRVEMSMPSGFKDLVIRRCEERGILIMPVDRWQEGKQVYKCGSGFIYFDKNVIFAEDNGTRWIPISIHTLLETVGFVAGNQPQSRVEMSMLSGFKDLVIRRCEERGILIMPVDRWQEGKQVYKCGSGFIYFDKNVIFAKDYGTRWIPISIQTLLETVGS